MRQTRLRDTVMAKSADTGEQGEDGFHATVSKPYSDKSTSTLNLMIVVVMMKIPNCDKAVAIMKAVQEN
ncbi:hypothetical protein [Nostoc sp. MS1]|uniref:hypothetical protein n=1 Tax=Nostoc sp. MS1 TaxID=2764711 RepID=UPI001CC5D139|nr:hypothetical protein [Nostoc sp. MS1]